MTTSLDIEIFLKKSGWKNFDRTRLKGDASSRRYERVTSQNQNAILMITPQAENKNYEISSEKTKNRESMGYNSLARLAGNKVEAFTCIAKELSIRGFSAPKIFASDLSKGLLLLEDLGDNLFSKFIQNNANQEKKLYLAAVDCLAAIYRSTFSKNLTFENSFWDLEVYDDVAMLAEVDLLLDWYAKDLGYQIDSQNKQIWHSIWKKLFNNFESLAPGLGLRDFHAENIFWLDERLGVEKIGLIDFQDALFVHPSYDLVSLVEDARRDVSPELSEILIDRFCQQSGIKNDERFRSAYAIMGAQRNAKILGIFIRLAKRDKKLQYLDFIPRVKGHLMKNLNSPCCDELKQWLEQNIPEIFYD